MPYEIIIGREGQQPFPIPDTCKAVSRAHARFIVDDNGNWFIEDIKGPQGNGTFVMDANGEFRSIQSKMINRDSVIRLGSGGYKSFTFFANRIIAPDNFSYEFNLLNDRLRAIRQEQSLLEAANEKKAKKIKVIRAASGVITLGLLAYAAIMKSPAGFAPAAISGAVTALLPAPDQKQLKALAEKKKAILVCPRCFSPISETAVNNRVCPLCKAKG